MKTTWKMAIATGITALGLAALAAGPLMSPKVSQALNLTPEQQQKMEDLRYVHQKDMIKFREELSLKRLDLQREMQKDSPDRATVDRIADDLGALRTRMGRARVDHLLDVRKILTPEQWSKARELMQAHRAQRMGGRGGRSILGPRDGMGHGAGSHRGQSLGQGPGPEGNADAGTSSPCRDLSRFSRRCDGIPLLCHRAGFGPPSWLEQGAESVEQYSALSDPAEAFCRGPFLRVKFRRVRSEK
jgi:Spy/CpxP family protein refolding chaperone